LRASQLGKCRLSAFLSYHQFSQNFVGSLLASSHIRSFGLQLDQHPHALPDNLGDAVDAAIKLVLPRFGSFKARLSSFVSRLSFFVSRFGFFVSRFGASL
jgi:hypothetical protein